MYSQLWRCFTARGSTEFSPGRTTKVEAGKCSYIDSSCSVNRINDSLVVPNNYLKYFSRWYFNQTLSIHMALAWDDM